MGVRKNVRFLSSAEREDFVRACVLMKADIVNPAAAGSDQYSRWDEMVAIHRMIQSAFAPGSASVNFGHGGAGRFSFLSWHRYFLYRMELELQSHVPGVMIPYWDWTNPATIMTDTFLGPDGTTGSEVRSGYFALDAPGTGSNPTPAPAWWPAGLVGWRLPSFAGFGTFGGALRRNISGVASLPTSTDLREVLDMPNYSQFQNGLESGSGLTSFPAQQLHNGMHGWIGGHMGNPTASPLDPIFYMLHANIDRLWAMWQVDGHANEYPLAGGSPHHHRNDLMYPWHGGAAGYGTTAAISSSIPMPDFAALGPQTNADTLDFRAAFGYTYDSIPVIGLGLDRTGSMTGLTPDPMIVAAPDVTKWEAAKRGVSAFLQDSETVYDSGMTYVVAGVKTFRRTGGGNEFDDVFPAPGYGLINGGTYSQATFDGTAATMSPGGSTPLADALVEVRNTLVDAPFGNLPADERRYLAMLTDGMLTSGSPMNSIPNASFTDVAVFGMGFGTGADVDYATIAAMVAKGGVNLPTTQVFHGENAGTIDKFYSDSLAAAMGFTTVIDPVLELFAGEHAHVDFHATSAEDSFFITIQGLDFDDENWTFMVHGPGQTPVYSEGGHNVAHGCGHHCCPPDVTAKRSNGRLSLVINRDGAEDACWVGTWRVMVCYRTRGIGAMVMPELGEFLAPVQAGPPRGARYSRLLLSPQSRVAVRNVHTPVLHALDGHVASTNRDYERACQAVVNIYARTRLRLSLVPNTAVAERGEEIGITLLSDVLTGSVTLGRSFARLLAPTQDLSRVIAKLKKSNVPKDALMEGGDRFDTAKVLAYLEKENPKLAILRDEQLSVVQHEDGPMHLHIRETDVAGPYHVAMYVEGTYCPEHATEADTSSHSHGTVSPEASQSPKGCGPKCSPQRFSRILTTSIAVRSTPARQSPRKKSKKRP